MIISRFGHDKIMELLTKQLAQAEQVVGEVVQAGQMAQLKRKKDSKWTRIARKKNTVAVPVRSERVAKVQYSTCGLCQSSLRTTAQVQYLACRKCV
jgi:hypothetical protein